jgi:hypothetical protein
VPILLRDRDGLAIRAQGNGAQLSKVIHLNGEGEAENVLQWLVGDDKGRGREKEKGLRERAVIPPKY